MSIELVQISEYLWEIPQTTRKDMRVPARIFASFDMLEHIKSDKSLQQLINVSTLPGIVNFAVVMPDVHEGYGFPIGAIAAIDYDEGIISPGGIGYDINCGVRILKTNAHSKDIRKHIEKIGKEFYNMIPSGVGKSGKTKLNQKELDSVLNTGVEWAIKQGYAEESDAEFIESSGSLKTADADKVSKQAKERGYDQLGTMGAGNHFVEIDKIEKIYDEKVAEIFGLFEGQIVIQIHTGSRGLGHQVATDYIKQMLQYAAQNKLNLPDRELSYAPIHSDVGKNYFAAMSASANFAWTNRQLITWQIREAWKNVFGKNNSQIEVLYDVAHNIAKIEEHTINNKKKKLIVHRKGATRAFPAHHPEIPLNYRDVGQPVLIPGSMGTASYILVGSESAMSESFGSTCHGAGRMLSRTKARKSLDPNKLIKELKNRGIEIITGSLKGLTEEAPEAYKSINTVVDIVHQAGIAKKIAQLKPLAVIKG